KMGVTTEIVDHDDQKDKNAGWADAMAKVLVKQGPKDAETVILPKKTDVASDEEDEEENKLERKRKQMHFQHLNTNHVCVVVVMQAKRIKIQLVKIPSKEYKIFLQINKKRKWEGMNFVKPNVLEKDYERSLQKVATRGVVQLFNAVKKHQKQMEEKLKSVTTESKKEKVIQDVDKGKFLDMLKDDEEDKPCWSVLRDDFLLGNNMKDWDKESDEEVGDVNE
uniref:RRP15-like protein n=1 Tax=Ciona intestinalis TaxID=7719 RepID=H2XX34_CIOIN